MELKNLQEKKNPFLERTEYIIEIKNETTPTVEEIKEALEKDNDLVIVKKINTNFGRHSFIVNLVVYDDIKSKEKIEVIPKKVRKKMEAEKKKMEEEARKAAEAAKKAEEEAKKAEEEAKKVEEEAVETKETDKVTEEKTE